MKAEKDVTVEITTMEDFKRELNILKGTVDILRDHMQTINVAFAARLDEYHKKAREIDYDISQLKMQNGRESQRRDNEIDSVEYGTAGKQGKVKIYLDSTKEDTKAEKEKVKRTLTILDFMRIGVDGGSAE